MAAACAVCLRPIVKPQAFAIWGTEVVHRECVGGLDRSIVNRQKVELIKLREVIAQHEIEVRRLQNDYDEANRERSAATRQLRDHDAMVLRARREVHEAQAREATLQRALDAANDRAAAAGRQVDAMRGERDAARREAQLHQTIQGAPRSTTSNTTEIPAPAVVTEDDAIVRFSLLELDIPE